MERSDGRFGFGKKLYPLAHSPHADRRWRERCNANSHVNYGRPLSAATAGFRGGLLLYGCAGRRCREFLIAGYLGPAIGWRACFYLLGIIGIITSLLLLFIRETPRRGVTQTPTSPAERGFVPTFKKSIHDVSGALKASPSLRYTIAGGVAFHFILGAAAFDQLWLVQERGFERAEIAVLSGKLAAAGGIIGTLLGGLLGDWWQARFQSGRTMFLFWTSLILLPFALLYRIVAPDSVFFELGIFLGFLQLGLFYGPTFSTVQELAPARIRATVVAFYLLSLNLVGLGIGITGGGILIDLFIARGHSEPYTVALLIFTGLSACAIPLMYLAGKNFVADRARLQASIA